MNIVLNGEKKNIPDGLTVEGLLRLLEIMPGRVAVEINEEIVRKAAYAETPVKDGDRVEVVQFMGGGQEDAGARIRRNIRADEKGNCGFAPRRKVAK